MLKTVTEAEKLRERILLMMKYDLRETYKENLTKLNEQETGYTMQLDRKYGDPEWLEREYQMRQDNLAKQKANTYPNYCKYPDRAVFPSSNADGLKGTEALVKGTCAYLSAIPWCQGPKIEVKRLAGTSYDLAQNEGIPRGETYILIPKDAEIRFVDSISDIHDIAETVWSAFTEKELKLLDRTLFIREIAEIIPLGAVKSFTVGSATYTGIICYKPLVIGKVPEMMSFGGWRDQNGNMYDIPFKRDDRTEYQKFVDEWGTVLQWTAVIVTAVAGLACEGCTWPLAAEIITELGLGAMVGFRELEKGQDVGAYVSFITGILPFLKISKSFRGISPQTFDEISKVFKESGLNSSSTVADYVATYDKLSDKGKLAFNQMMRSDEISRGLFLGRTATELGDEVANATFAQLRAAFEADPQLLRRIPLTKRLWFRELGTNFTTAAAGLTVNILYGDKLNKEQSKKLTEEMKDKLDGIYDVLSPKLKKEMEENYYGNIMKSEQYLNDPQLQELREKAKELHEKGYSEALDIYWKNRNKKIIEDNEGVYKPAPETADVPLLEMESIDDKKLEEMKKNGWVNFFELGRDINKTDSLLNVNGDIYVKKNN